MQKKVLVTEKLASEGIEKLEAAGFEVDVKLKMPSEQLVAEIPEYAGLIVRSATHVTSEVIKAAKNLEVIGRAGVGTENIDVAAATEAGITVCNAPTSNIISAAEYTMAVILNCARNITAANNSVHAGVWSRAAFCGVELYDKTLAIVGLGRIGGLVAQRARAFGMRLVGYDPYCSQERAEQLGVALYDNLEELLPEADFITVHVPKTQQTTNMFDANEFAAMKEGVVLVNCARGGIYNTKSLANFIAAGKVRAVGFDAFDDEPCTTSPLHEFKNATLTPHLAAYTHEAQKRTGIQIAQYVCTALNGGIVPTALNMSTVPPDVVDALGPYVPACQMMGSMLAQILQQTPKRLSIVCAGGAAPANSSVILAGILQGLFPYHNTSRISSANSKAFAHRHGIKVDSGIRTSAGAYASSVSVEADGLEIACTLSGDAQQVRLISFLGYKVDIEPAAHALVFEYVDTPGKIGIIGSILGDAGVNISTMQIRDNPNTKMALVYMNVDGNVTQEVLDALKQSVGDLKNLWNVAL